MSSRNGRGKHRPYRFDVTRPMAPGLPILWLSKGGHHATHPLLTIPACRTVSSD
jgi:hypothetical protein